MALTREIGRAAPLIDVLDRILDKGMVIDAWIRVSLVEVDLRTVEARVVIASLETYIFNYVDVLALSHLVSSPPLTVSGELEHSDKESELPTRPPHLLQEPAPNSFFRGETWPKKALTAGDFPHSRYLTN